MSDPLDDAQAEEVLRSTVEDALDYLRSVADRPVRTATTDATARTFGGPLPEDGVGSPAALARLVAGLDGAHASAGPRFFHFVTGGVTPAALAADWLASAVDQNSFSWASSPLGGQLEATAIRWLLDLFGLPATWGGVLTTGATMANFTALATARSWWAERHGVESTATGWPALLPSPDADLLQRARASQRHEGPGHAGARARPRRTAGGSGATTAGTLDLEALGPGALDVGPRPSSSPTPAR